ncbi:hypothetical protein SAMN06296386_103238 [Lachnospiraceae bacterium]|nr:hypothetical protein SAMN06296386_103238 [Lachnospiraceae bacterium]
MGKMQDELAKLIYRNRVKFSESGGNDLSYIWDMSVDVFG